MKPPPPPPPHLTVQPLPGAAGLLPVSGKAGDRPSSPASGQTRPRPTPALAPSASKGMGGMGPVWPWAASRPSPAAKVPLEKPAGTARTSPGPSEQMATWPPKSQQYPPLRPAPPRRTSRAFHALLAAFLRKNQFRVPRPIPSPKRAAPQRGRRPGAAGHRVWPLVAPPNPNPEAGAYRDRACLRRNWAELYPARLAF